MWKWTIRAGVVGLTGAFIIDSRQNPSNPLWTRVGMSVMQSMDPESAHRKFIQAAKFNLLPYLSAVKEAECKKTNALRVRVWGMEFQNPIGVAAGLDKHAEAMDPLLNLGFGFTEVGSITPKPQPGNPQPRVFRLTADKAVINRYGFNSDGLEAAKQRLETYRRNRADPQSIDPVRKFLKAIGWSPAMSTDGLVGVNVGCNKENVADPAADYTAGILQLGPLADYVVVNISSPNTPGLRALQKKEMLENLVKRSIEAQNAVRAQTSRQIPLLVKISPDLSEQEMKDIADIALKLKVDGLIVSNTTTSRPMGLQSSPALVDEVGGLSGAPLKRQATRVLRSMYELTGGKIPLIGSGGIATAEDAYERIRAGASLVQLYTALTYEGPEIASNINQDLVKLLSKDGFTKISQAIGADHRMAKSK